MEFFGINIKNRAPARQKKNKIMNTNTMKLNLEAMETVNGGIELDESTKFQINLEIRISKARGVTLDMVLKDLNTYNRDDELIEYVKSVWDELKPIAY